MSYLQFARFPHNYNGIFCRQRKNDLQLIAALSGPFSAGNLERTVRELNDLRYLKLFGGSYLADGKSRRSAVLIPLCEHNGQPSILFTLRSNRLARHKGYPCFPGGIADASDSDLVQTAIRETREELGICPDNITVVGVLPRFKLPRDDMEITAVVADIGDIDSHNLEINYNEVSVVFSRTIDELCHPENTGETTFRVSKGNGIYTTPVFLAGPYKIWGVTGILLHLFLSRLVPEQYRRPAKPIIFKRTYASKKIEG